MPDGAGRDALTLQVKGLAGAFPGVGSWSHPCPCHKSTLNQPQSLPKGAGSHPADGLHSELCGAQKSI